MPYEDLIDGAVAEEQGALFIFQCLKILLESPGVKGPYDSIRCEHREEILVNSTPTALLTNLLKNIAPSDQPLKILLHLDEHRNMCPREVENLGNVESKGALFSRGAMQNLGMVPQVTVVATYTARPPLPAVASSGVCRIPVGLPCLNIDAVMQEVEDLRFPHSQK